MQFDVSNATGQSGLMRHPHRTDMLEKWENVEYIHMPFSREKVEQTAAHPDAHA